MIELSNLQDHLRNTLLEDWSLRLNSSIARVLAQYTHGELTQWQAMIDALPDIQADSVELDSEVRVNSVQPQAESQVEQLTEQLMLLHPWRKGPFHIHGLDINTEWRSDWKWDRIRPHLTDMGGQMILDIGCGNGYHLFRMIGAGARTAIGIDPSQKFYAQFLAMNHFIKNSSVFHLPVGIEDLPEEKIFDKVFSMGVLYHRRSPIDHIQQLKRFVKKGGELILETLVVEGDENTVLLPAGRYAQMRNVWFLPSTAALEGWLKRCNLADVKLVDCKQTSLDEQRSTDWMHFHSLKNYLDPQDINKTVEGYPAPVRATFIAHVPD
jgi:tRNA (mo5U34)-methyltransferase